MLLNALGDMLVARDPLGIKPLCYAIEGPLFAAASESVALLNLGFAAESIKSLLPGQAVTITDGQLEIQRFAASPRRAHCFFEWIYFANVASTLDGRSVYLSRKALGEELARLETVPIDEDTIVVPVPDTSKAAADAMAYAPESALRRRADPQPLQRADLHRRRRQPQAQGRDQVHAAARSARRQAGVPGRGFDRPLHDAEGAVASGFASWARPREIHVRVACPPIIAPCFYGIDMSTISELFAPQFLQGRAADAARSQADMAAAAGRRFAPLSAGRVDRPGDRLRRRPALPGLHHRRLSDALRPGAVPDRPAKRRRSQAGADLRKPVAVAARSRR